MSMTKTEMTQRVYSRLAADSSNPTYTDIDSSNLYRWADEEVTKVMNRLEPVHYQKLVVIDESLSGGDPNWTLPSTFFKGLAVKANTERIKCDLYTDPKEFARWDSRNFVLTPTIRNPKALIYNNLVYLKPDTLAKCYLDYVKTHPTFSGISTTSLSATADAMLVDLLVARAMAFLEEYDQAKLAYLDAELSVNIKTGNIKNASQ